MSTITVKEGCLDELVRFYKNDLASVYANADEGFKGSYLLIDAQKVWPDLADTLSKNEF